MLCQEKEIDEHSEEQQRALLTMEFNADTTFDEIRSLDQHVAALSRQHSDLTADRVDAHAVRGEEEDDDDDDGAATGFNQV